MLDNGDFELLREEGWRLRCLAMASEHYHGHGSDYERGRSATVSESLGEVGSRHTLRSWSRYAEYIYCSKDMYH